MEARSDIVERLRAADISGHGSYSALVREAADETERLTTALEVCQSAGKELAFRLDELRRAQMLAMEGRTVHGGWRDVGNKP